MVELITVDVGPIAHGGHCVARHEGRVVFVRDALPGERVLAEVVDASKDRFWWAKTREVLEASLDRRTPPCPVAGSCGGCDFQHVDLVAQRQLKAAVVREQLLRLAGIDREVVVEQVSGDDHGLGWRTRMRYLANSRRIGLRAWRSNELVELPSQGCLIAHPAGLSRDELQSLADRDSEVQVSVGHDDVSVLRDGELIAGPQLLTETVEDRRYKVAADGFWQVHPGAAATLSAAAVDQLQPKPGDKALDLYCGVGLFAGALADLGCEVTGVEINAAAVNLARQNVPTGHFLAGRLDRVMPKLASDIDLIVLDPPRTGAGADVVANLAGKNARTISYVACDPAALARDLRHFAEHGWQLSALRAFDLFPMTHHVECVAKLERF